MDEMGDEKVGSRPGRQTLLLQEVRRTGRGAVHLGSGLLGAVRCSRVLGRCSRGTRAGGLVSRDEFTDGEGGMSRERTPYAMRCDAIRYDGVVEVLWRFRFAGRARSAVQRSVDTHTQVHTHTPTPKYRIFPLKLQSL